ncbi:MAG: 3-deoxy-8-phosphooctulonate synthase [Bdellovibrionales bacterium]|jgi:2-dehydro-3-deoxyphosphooctonate aldolase (KDO 8-P synthase)|nr:3-deoxy-8-phosphooctulonate synthase [Bdellovibrionales bacterium]MBT3527391.1 3-deoxy-8-phosphooctulonate synthase [Bdellovibrionales bacterium]MBT7669108.1 3-deoxy-8-phosphooctulonate synthase [Bdellovibrionales bacterium]MBT7766357.1 3-deoxy-8-phosphooctulonate synthase [Bdellovibrionales bacterium]
MRKLECYIGPCVLESEEMALDLAGAIKRDLSDFDNQINLYFKGSFDKANRSSLNSFRGLGIEKGLKILAKVKEQYGLPLVTDFHAPEQADSVAKVVDVLQIPAFLCRQTDMIVAGAKACKENGRILKVKKGQFLSPPEVVHIVNKAMKYLPQEQIVITERGSSFGYNNLIVDMSSFMIIQQMGVRAIYDATHSVQRPGGAGDITGGKPEQVEVLARAAIAAGADGIFIEVHRHPQQALSDSTTCLPVTQLRDMIKGLLQIFQAT